MEFEVKRLDERAKLPNYAREDDAGLDIYSLEEVVIPARGRATVRTGIAFAIPAGYVGLVWDRSGLAAQAGLHHMAGVIDAGYRGEFRVVLLNTTDRDYRVSGGDKIAQLLIQPVAHVEVQEVKELLPSERGQGGFGSTGK